MAPDEGGRRETVLIHTTRRTEPAGRDESIDTPLSITDSSRRISADQCVNGLHRRFVQLPHPHRVGGFLSWR